MLVVDVEAMGKAQTVDIAKPPMKTVPDQFYPRLVYKHPKVHYRTVIDRPNNAAPTERLVPNDPKILKVNSDEELAEALAKGWRKEMFVPKPLDDSDLGIEYEGDEPKKKK